MHGQVYKPFKIVTYMPKNHKPKNSKKIMTFIGLIIMLLGLKLA